MATQSTRFCIANRESLTTEAEALTSAAASCRRQNWLKSGDVTRTRTDALTTHATAPTVAAGTRRWRPCCYRGWLAQAKAAKEHAAWQQFSAQEAFQLPITPNTTQLEITTAPVQVFGRRVMRGAIQQISGERGYSTTRQDGVDVVVTNRLAVPTTLHFHGLILPNAMDGVPFTTQPPIPPGERLRLRFPLQQDGTFWLHSHYGLQAQSFVAEPLLISTPEQDRWADHSFTVMLRDFSYTPAERILRNLVNGERGGGTAMARQLAGFPWHQPRPLRVQTWDEGAQRFRWEERSGVLMQPDVIFDAAGQRAHAR